MNPRIPLVGDGELPEQHRNLVTSGFYVHRTLANSVGAANSIRGVAQYLRRDSPLDGRMRELAILQVCWSTRCIYEYAHHLKIALSIGLTGEDIKAIAAGNAWQRGDVKAEAVLIAAKKIVEDGVLGDEDFSALRREFDAECLTDLIVTISFYIALARIIAVFEIEVEPEYLPLLDRFPMLVAE